MEKFGQALRNSDGYFLKPGRFYYFLARPVVEARPPLHFVNPVVFGIATLYSVFNLILFPAFLMIPAGYILPGVIWGIIFAGVGIFGLYGVIRDNWRVIHITLLVGLTLKLIWAFFLVPTIPHGGYAVAAIWFLIASIQFWVVVHFPNGHHVVS